MDTELCQPMSLILPDDASDDDDDDDGFLEVVESPKKPAGIVLPPDADLEPLEAKPPRGRQRILVLKRSAAATTTRPAQMLPPVKIRRARAPQMLPPPVNIRRARAPFPLFKSLSAKRGSGKLQDAVDRTAGIPQMPSSLKAHLDLVGAGVQPAHFSEFFCPSTVAPCLRDLGYSSSMSYDKRNGFDLLQEANQRRALADQKRNATAISLFCPPCTMLCQLQKSNWHRMREQEKWTKLREAIALLDFSIWGIEMQLCAGRGFIFEHPETSMAWTRPNMQDVGRWKGVFEVVFDQCMTGLVSPKGTPIKKRTRLLTNIPHVCRAFACRQCDGSHDHVICQDSEDGHKLSQWAQEYPKEMIDLFASAIADFLEGK